MRLSSIELQSVQLSLGNPAIKILRDVNLVFKPGIHCLLGPNGAGKTVTNRLLAMIEEVDSGSILWDGVVVNPFTDLKRQYLLRIGYMRQEPVFVRRTVRSNISLPLKFRDLDEEMINIKVDRFIEQFDLSEMEEKFIEDLSTGQRQKVALARTLITEPDLIILDEPTASLDMATTKWFEEHIIKENASDGKVIIWTTHDQFQVKRIAERASIIINGSIRSTGPVREVIDNQEDPMLKDYLAGELIELE